MYRQGEIVLIPVPFSDLSASKKRPVLVISNDGHNAASQDIIVKRIGRVKDVILDTVRAEVIKVISNGINE